MALSAFSFFDLFIAGFAMGIGVFVSDIIIEFILGFFERTDD